MTNEEFGEYFRKRTKAWAIRVVKYVMTLSESPVVRVVRYQLIKSATSTAANYRAACRARSNAEFHSKISVSLEEADESLFWLEFIQDYGLDNSDELKYLIKENEEIIAVLATARKNTEK